VMTDTKKHTSLLSQYIHRYAQNLQKYTYKYDLTIK